MKRFWMPMIVACSLLFAADASAQSAEQIKKVEDYLNNLKTLEADFVQTASNGGYVEGKIYIAKPNKIRMEYDDPASILIVGDGDFIVYNDKELDQVTHIDYDDIPATLILANDIKIDGKNLKVSDFYEDSGSTSVTLEYVKKSDVGPITLVFNNSPFELKQWKIIDPQSVEVTVSIYNTAKDGDIDDSTFKFKKEKSSPLNYKNKNR